MPKHHGWPVHNISLCYACGNDSDAGELCTWCRDESEERVAQFLGQYAENLEVK